MTKKSKNIHFMFSIIIAPLILLSAIFAYGYWYVHKPKPYCEQKSNDLNIGKCPNIQSFWHVFYDVNPCPVCINREHNNNLKGDKND